MFSESTNYRQIAELVSFIEYKSGAPVFLHQHVSACFCNTLDCKENQWLSRSTVVDLARSLIEQLAEKTRDSAAEEGLTMPGFTKLQSAYCTTLQEC